MKNLKTIAIFSMIAFTLFSCHSEDYDPVAKDQSKKVLNLDNLTGKLYGKTRQYNITSLKSEKPFDFWNNDEWFYQFADPKNDCKRRLHLKFINENQVFKFSIPKCEGREEERFSAFFQIVNENTIDLEFVDYVNGEYVKNGKTGVLRNVKLDIDAETKNSSRKHVVSFTSSDLVDGHELEFVGKGY